MIKFLNGALQLHQPEYGLKSTSDAVFLAAACPVKNGETVLDMGCGVGTVGLCVKSRVPSAVLTGIDFQQSHIELARQNAKDNVMVATFICGDIADKRDDLYHHIVCNPPFLETHKGSLASSADKAMATHHDTDLRVWITAAHRLLKAKGTFSLIHRADHIDQILAALYGKFGRIEIIPLWPKQGHQAKRIIIRAVKDSRTPAIMTAGLVLHNDDGSFTTKADQILRGQGI